MRATGTAARSRTWPHPATRCTTRSSAPSVPVAFDLGFSPEAPPYLYEERAEWHRVVVWDERLVDVIERRARKGTLVALEGQIRTRRWSGRDGKDNHSTEVVLDRFTSRFQVLSGARPHEEPVDGVETNQPVFDKRFAFDELPF